MAEYTIKTPMWTADKTLYRPGRRQVSDAHARELNLVSVQAETQPNTTAGTLDGIDFASDAAREAATEAGLTAEAFKGASPSSQNGYTKPDVQALIDARGA